ncbi:MAG: formyltransferase family protein [Planctomycetota bacterium]
MVENKYKQIVLVGDTVGILLLMKYAPQASITGIIAAGVRPQYINELSELSKNLGIRFLIQPEFKTNRYSGFLTGFKKLNADLLICNSYSMVIREDILKLINYNAVNVHWALLPKNRGPNPVQWAIIKEESQTGVTVHYMNDGIDSGDIIAQKAVPIDFKDTWCALSNKLSAATEDLLEEEIPRILTGVNKRFPQDNSQATRNTRLRPESPRIDFKVMTDMEIYNLIRAQVKPLKGAYLEHNGEKVYFPEFIEHEKVKELRKKYAG